MKNNPTIPVLPERAPQQDLKPNQAVARDIEQAGVAAEQHVIDSIVAMVKANRDYSKVFAPELTELGLGGIPAEAPRSQLLYQQAPQPDLETTRRKLESVYDQEDSKLPYAARHLRIVPDEIDQALQDMDYHTEYQQDVA